VGESAPSVSTANTKLGIPSYVCCWSGATGGSGEKECFPIVFANNMSALQLQMMESHQSGARKENQELHAAAGWKDARRLCERAVFVHPEVFWYQL